GGGTVRRFREYPQKQVITIRFAGGKAQLHTPGVMSQAQGLINITAVKLNAGIVDVTQVRHRGSAKVPE
ncbi:hypothetical protein OJ593_11315, partial [Streptococcus anginosus]|nr:hypothetical protein [Streptococcus anginosus]